MNKSEAKMKKVLILDEDKTFADSLKEPLAQSGFETVRAATSEEALTAIKAAKPDLIILEAILGGKGDGIIFSRKIRENLEYSQFAGIPMLMISAIRGRTAPYT